MNAKSSSIVEYFGSDEGHKCGYCRGLKSNLSHGIFSVLNMNSNESYCLFHSHLGMWAHTMSVEDYENLINRGWRRSGNHFSIFIFIS